jgi:hypothetical protein
VRCSCCSSFAGDPGSSRSSFELLPELLLFRKGMVVHCLTRSCKKERDGGGEGDDDDDGMMIVRVVWRSIRSIPPFAE